MFLLASSVCGLFKWRQFEPEVIHLLPFHRFKGISEFLFISPPPPIDGTESDSIRPYLSGGRPPRQGRLRELKYVNPCFRARSSAFGLRFRQVSRLSFARLRLGIV